MRNERIKKQELYLSFLPHVRNQFSNLPGVQTIGLGAKEKNGEPYKEWAFRFYVDKKIPSEKLPQEQVIPPSVFGVQTDVIPFNRLESLVCESSLLNVQNDEFRDSGMRGGASIRNTHFENDHPSGYGTLGILARTATGNNLVALTCAHVVNAGSESYTELNTEIGQPKYWLSCCCCPRGVIGKVSKATFNEHLDCALIEIDEDIEEKVNSNSTENDIENIGTINGAAAIACFDTVRKFGRATGLTSGEVTDIAFGTNQMLIERTDGNPGDPFACHGDSGAMLVNSSDQVVGMVVAGEREHMNRTIVTHIKPVMEELDITIAGSAAADLGEPLGSEGACEVMCWPGGQADTALNPVETFTSADFGMSGSVDWDVGAGGAGASIVEADGSSQSAGTTQFNAAEIKVRYDQTSPSSNANDSVYIQANDGSTESTKFRVVFTLTPTLNTSGTLHANNTKRFDANGGTNDDQPGMATPGTNGASWFMAKAEIIYEISPQGLDWGSNNITFQHGNPGGSEGDVVSRRETMYSEGEQASGDPHRTHNEVTLWTSAGDSTANDLQEPTAGSPDQAFRLANEGFDPSGMLQKYRRADYRDYLEIHDGNDWVRITPYTGWHANLTGELSGTGSPPPAVGGTNNIGSGSNSENIPNQPPEIADIPVQEVQQGEPVTLTAVPSDPDNDEVTVSWAETTSQGISLSSNTGDSVTFNAPANDPQLKFEATPDDGTDSLTRTAGNSEGAAVEAIVNVVEWKNTGGGDPVQGRNMTEEFEVADFGIGAGPYNWDVTTGGTNAVIIEADGAAVGPTGTHNGANRITVRYDNKSGGLDKADTVKIQATNPSNGKSWFKRRTVFRVIVAVHATDNESHEISSVQAAGKDHFCTAKQGGNMVLDATLDPVPPNGDIDWDATGRAITVPSVGGDRSTAHIDRNPANGMKIPFKIQVSGDDVYEGLSWIIWSTGTLENRVAPNHSFTAIQTIITGTYQFKFVIEPATIITDADRPDLQGPNTSNPPDVDPGDVSVWNQGNNLVGGANRKWDVTRRLKQKVFNEANIPNSVARNPSFYNDYTNFPSDNEVGNDDMTTNDPEDNNPYNAPIGEIWGIDSPSEAPFNAGANAEGSVGDTFEVRIHFQEFARVELDGNWYVISDPLLWRFHIKGLKADESDDGVDYDGDGAQNKELWINDNSILDNTNNGW